MLQDENHWRTSRLCIYLEAHLHTLNYISSLKIMFPASIFIKMPPKFRWWVYSQNEKEQETHIGHNFNGKPGIKRNDESLKARWMFATTMQQSNPFSSKAILCWKSRKLLRIGKGWQEMHRLTVGSSSIKIQMKKGEIMILVTECKNEGEKKGKQNSWVKTSSSLI